jgi:hypothetical protein
MREATIEECERCVPEDKWQGYAGGYTKGFNDCRAATLTALSALKGELPAKE